MDLENEQSESVALPLPVVPRLDRLDHLIKLLEDNHKLLKKQESNYNAKGANADDDDGDDDRILKPVSTALDEVHFKGTLMDRIALLEHRVLQLSLQMDMEHKSSGLSSIKPPPIAPDAAISGHGSSKGSVRIQQQVLLESQQQDVKRMEKTSMVIMQGCGIRRWRRNTPAENKKNLFEWLHI